MKTKKKTPILDFYNHVVNQGRRYNLTYPYMHNGGFGAPGLCYLSQKLKFRKHFALFKPTPTDRYKSRSDFNPSFFLSGSGKGYSYELTPMRANVLILIACMKGEM